MFTDLSGASLRDAQAQPREAPTPSAPQRPSPARPRRAFGPVARWVAGSVVAWSTACGATAPEAPPMPDTLPTPFTADQIRDAFPAGTVIVWQQERAGELTHNRWTVAASDAQGMDLTVDDAFDGDAATTRTARHPWIVLRDHALFPVHHATRTRTSISTLLSTHGPMPAWRYDVEAPGAPDASPTLTTFWFADALPGPPVRMDTTRDGALVTRLQQVARTGTDTLP